MTKTLYKAEFSHCMYDDITETLFMYFNNGTIQDLSGAVPEQEIEELCIWVDPTQYEKMRQYFIDHPTKETM